jgi:AraC family transcriptional regulator
LYECTPGSLLFHNWQDSHYNIKPPGFTRGFHIELAPHWFDQYGIDAKALQGSMSLQHPVMKVLLYNIVRETKLSHARGAAAIDALLIQLFGLMNNGKQKPSAKRPAWAGQLQALLQEAPDDWNLTELAQQLNIHPVHLSRDFSKHFHCTLGDYIRTLRVQRALSMLPDAALSITDIALQCGFADQSHFIRSFRALLRLSPLQYKKQVLQKQIC